MTGEKQARPNTSHGVVRLEIKYLIADRALAARQILFGKIAALLDISPDHLADHEVHLIDKILVGLVDYTQLEVRAELARRLSLMDRPPPQLLRRFACDAIVVARPILEASPALSDSDLLSIIRQCSPAHRIAIARRRPLSADISAILVREAFDRADPEVALLHDHNSVIIEVLLGNAAARFDDATYELLAEKSREMARLRALLRARADLPSAVARVISRV
jgi:uncharacterized protein (DUF2336 family)